MKMANVLGAVLAVTLAGCAASSDDHEVTDLEETEAAAGTLRLADVAAAPVYFAHENRFAVDRGGSVYARFTSRPGRTITLDARSSDGSAVAVRLYEVTRDGRLGRLRRIKAPPGQSAVTWDSQGTGAYVVQLLAPQTAAELEIRLTCAGGLCSTDAQPGQMCGGIAGIRCADGLYCDFAPAANCGAYDRSGTCEFVPEACSQDFDPVCGCDGRTYGNDCVAAMAGVSVRSTGECGPTVVGVGESCGGFTLGGPRVCGEGLYCKYAPDAICGRADAAGTCAERPEACTKELAPVCGCDGQTYSNACTAAASGISVDQPGACASAPVE